MTLPPTQDSRPGGAAVLAAAYSWAMGVARERLRLFDRCPRALALAISLTPALLAVVEVGAFYRHTLFHFLPHYSDEVIYWTMARTFATHGFLGGYHVADEHLPPWSFSQFNAHGPGFPLVYGSIAAVLGWHNGNLPWTNAALLAAALYVFLRSTALRSIDAIAAGAIVCMCFPVQMYLPSGYEESLNQAIAIGLTAAIAPLFDSGPRSGRRITILVCLVLYAVFLRASWAIVAIPLALLIPSRRFKSTAALAAASATAVSWVVLWLWSRLAAPFPQGEFQFVNPGQILQNLTGFRHYIAANAVSLFTLHMARYERAQQLQILLVVAWSAAVLAAHWRSHRTLLTINQSPLWIAIYNLVAIVVCTLMVYVIGSGGSFRVWAPHLLLSTLLLLATRQRRVLWLCLGWVIIASIGARSFLGTFREEHAVNFAYDESAVDRAAVILARTIHYDPASARWCNTLLSLNNPYVWAPITSVPAGIGISAVLSWQDTSLPLRSRYVLLDEAAYHTTNGGSVHLTSEDDGTTRLEFSTGGYIRAIALGQTPLGTVYENRDASCPSLHAPPFR